jgi:hypothetical protein
MMATFDSWGTSFGSPSAWATAWVHSGAQPTPGREGLGGDDKLTRGLKSPHRGWNREAWKRDQQREGAIEETLREVYSELTGQTAAVSTLARVDAITRPVAARQPDADVPLRIDWAKLARDFERANALIRLQAEERELQAMIADDDDLLMMLQ